MSRLIQPESSGEHEGVSETSVKGRLAKHISFWRDMLQASPFILYTIQSGYVMPLEEEPTRFSRPNQASVLRNADSVSQAIDELLLDGRAREVQERLHVCSPLSIVVSTSCRYLSCTMQIYKFVMGEVWRGAFLCIYGAALWSGHCLLYFHEVVKTTGQMVAQ